MSSNDIQARIDALKAEQEALQKEAKAAAQAEAKAIGVEYDWKVEWKNKYVFACSRTLTAEIAAARAAWREKYPHETAPWFSGDAQVQGMRYILVTNVLSSVGGGYVVLKTSRENKGFGGFDEPPLELTDEEVQSFHDGVVPDSLKA